jgi:hypothetical protein
LCIIEEESLETLNQTETNQGPLRQKIIHYRRNRNICLDSTDQQNQIRDKFLFMNAELLNHFSPTNICGSTVLSENCRNKCFDFSLFTANIIKQHEFVET